MVADLNIDTYNITCTAGAALLNETSAVVQAFYACSEDWERTRESTLSNNLMQKEKLSTSKRLFSLVKQRLQALNDDERYLLANDTPAQRRLLVLLAICKAHSFIRDFIVEVVRENFYNLDEKVSYANFNEFFNEKKYLHPKLERLSDQTIRKMRQTAFRILEQTELVESAKTGILHRPYLTEKVEQLIVKDNPKWLSIYLYSNDEISKLTH